MEYCIVDGNQVITNIIVCSDQFASKINALPYYDDASIGDKYNPPDPPIPEPTEMEQLRADVDYLLMMQEG